MSYQIKSTPFFRRMVSTSKKNGQLQKLKEEYERMKEFNDRSIEMKMRQVRLNRLFREIEDMKDAASSQFKRRRTEKAKTEEEIRLETLQKSKTLGTEFSKINGTRTERCYARLDATRAIEMNHTMHASPSLQSPTNQRKALIAKRINYGNESSRRNIEYINSTPKRNLKREHSSGVDEQKNKLRQRLNYGNSWSNINMAKIPRRNAKHLIVTDGGNILDLKSLKSLDELIDDSLAIADRIVNRESTVYPTYEEVQNRQFQIKSIAPPILCTEVSRQRARNYWRKVRLTVRNRFNTMRRRSWYSLNLAEEFEEENRLRSISNDTHLPLSSLNPKPISMGSQDNGNDDYEPGEILLKVEMLSHPTSQSNESNPNDVPPKQLDPNEAINKEAEDAETTVQKYVKMLEPYVRRAAQKEVFEFGVQQLRNIFEHQSE